MKTKLIFTKEDFTKLADKVIRFSTNEHLMSINDNLTDVSFTLDRDGKYITIEFRTSTYCNKYFELITDKSMTGNIKPKEEKPKE